MSPSRWKRSIRLRLILRLCLLAVIIWVLLALAVKETVRHELAELYDGELAQLARLILSVYEITGALPDAGEVEALVTSTPFDGADNYEHKLLFQIWDARGALLVRSSNAPVEPIVAVDNSFSTVDLFGHEVRVFGLAGPDGRVRVHVGQRNELREDLVEDIAESFLWVLLLSLPLVLLAIVPLVSRSLSPLLMVEKEIASRSPRNLDPIAFDVVPLEIRSLVATINGLFNRLDAAARRERAFIADASHELRTPLAGLKAQAQLGLQDPGRARVVLENIVRGVDRTSRLANQLLALSRVEADEGAPRAVEISLATLLGEILDDLGARIREKSLEVTRGVDPAIKVISDREMLFVLLRNLLENAVVYSPAEGSIEITASPTPGRIDLMIRDHGPGIRDDNLERVFDRFYREPGSDAPGSGLGLAIVRRIAERLGIQVRLANHPEGGLAARISLVAKVG